MAAPQCPIEKIMNVTDTKQQFSKVLNEVARGESYVVVEKSGAPVAAIISQRELEEYRELKRKDDEVRERLDRNLRMFSEAFRGVPDEDFERALADARREYREITDRQHGRS